MGVHISWGEARHASPEVYPPHPDATGSTAPGVGIDGDWVGHDLQGPTDYALTLDADGVVAITGTLDELADLADRISLAIEAAVPDHPPMTTEPDAAADNQITWDGRNSRAVRAFIESIGCDPNERWFITRSETASSGGQAWRYVKAASVGPAAWGDDVKAAVYDPRVGLWRAVRRGTTIRRAGSGFDVDHP